MDQRDTAYYDHTLRTLETPTSRPTSVAMSRAAPAQAADWIDGSASGA
jgi:hypothetical protein